MNGINEVRFMLYLPVVAEATFTEKVKDGAGIRLKGARAMEDQVPSLFLAVKFMVPAPAGDRAMIKKDQGDLHNLQRKLNLGI